MASFRQSALALTATLSLAYAWLPSTTPLRGVNLGGQFIVEPWMMKSEWSTMGCSGQADEWSCVQSLGQDKADAAFQSHWGRWITQSDFEDMHNYGLNTVRIPTGYWMKEDLVKDGEYFPRGGLEYLLKVCGWAADQGIYVILEQHAAPGAQANSNSFTGHSTTAGFYTSENYDRGVEYVAWLANLTYNHNEMRTVGTIGVLNEPLNWDNKVSTLVTDFYPAAYKAIRAVEPSGSNPLHIQFMGSKWGSGSPESSLPSGYTDVSFEDHRYLKWDTSVSVTQDEYIKTSCTSDRTAAGEDPTYVTEWSLSPPDDVESTDGWSKDSQKEFYGNWFAAQVQGFEKSAKGWTFWTWKSTLGDYRWSYQDAVTAGVAPKDLDSLASSTVCG
ncbi:putative Glucan endo-1,6-beta-glucosidase B [Seiridium unicorne]|uniref:glucan endo-1,6-beta-glucosidase n=1 Tax=Seiridium unicorne TaxID=138068 RepID=A0ABR2UWR3_9PEZI